MTLFKNTFLFYCVIFLLLGLLSIARNESIASVTSSVMSMVFFVIHLIVKSTDEDKELDVQVNN